MGNAASANILNKDQKAFITQKLKKMYDENADTMDPETLNKTLSAEYQRLAGSFFRLNLDDISASKKELSIPLSSRETPRSARNNTTKTTTTSAASGVPATLISSRVKAEGGLKSVGGAKGKSTGRRRSFDMNSKSAKTLSEVSQNTESKTSLPTAAETGSVNISKSHGALEHLTEVVADSWDSVTTQPYCDICKMAFKSAAFLDRHVKFSSIHAENMSKQPTSPNALLSPLKSGKKELAANAQEEGMHYRLLYAGAKFFWRTQESIDFDIYHHFLAHAVEIIPFNTSKMKEMPRIYCDYEAVLLAVEKSVAEEVEMKITEIKKDKFADAPDRAKLREEVLLKKVVTYLLQRLQFSQGICDFTPLSADDPEHFPILQKAPVVLIPIKITRRRKSTTEEVQETLFNISSDRRAIGASLEKASQFTALKHTAEQVEYSNKIAHLVYDAALVLSTKPWYADKSKPLRTFIRAATLVIHKARVERTKDLLDMKGMNVPKGLPKKRGVMGIPTSPERGGNNNAI